MPFDRDKFDRDFDRVWKRGSKLMVGWAVFVGLLGIGALGLVCWLTVAAVGWLGRH